MSDDSSCHSEDIDSSKGVYMCSTCKGLFDDEKGEEPSMCSSCSLVTSLSTMEPPSGLAHQLARQTAANGALQARLREAEGRERALCEQLCAAVGTIAHLRAQIKSMPDRVNDLRRHIRDLEMCLETRDL